MAFPKDRDDMAEESSKKKPAPKCGKKAPKKPAKKGKKGKKGCK